MTVSHSIARSLRASCPQTCAGMSGLLQSSPLKKLPPMQTQAHDEMRLEQRAGLRNWANRFLLIQGQPSYPEVSLTVLTPGASSPAAAITSISTLAFFGKAATATVERAGGFCRK